MATATDIKTTDLLLRPEFAPKVLDGTKSMTRRIINPQPPDGATEVRLENPYGIPMVTYRAFPNGGTARWAVCECPYGQPGDRLRFLTTWAAANRYDHRKPLDMTDSAKIWTAFDGPKPGWCGKSRPGRFMPLWMRNRLPVFELTDVGVERAQEASAKDIVAEGVVERAHESQFGKQPVSALDGCAYWDLKSLWASVWEKVNGKGAWQRNEWCWTLAFRHVTEDSHA